MTPHPGGWLPNWVFVDWDPDQREARENLNNGRVLLRHRSGNVRRDYSGPKARRIADKETQIDASLVAAIVPKPIPVTGWALPAEEADGRYGGAKGTHLAVPAGAIYYFAARSETDAHTLALSLNWHGATNGTEIKNRRSTLMGEKGFGLGVCGTWKYYGEGGAA